MSDIISFKTTDSESGTNIVGLHVNIRGFSMDTLQ